MTMFKIDARGDVCPLPVIKVKKALRDHPEVVITVDNEIATQNLTKMANQLGLKSHVEEISAQAFHVTIFPDGNRGEVPVETSVATPVESSYVVVIDGKTMGSGNDALGYTLLKGFIYSLTEQDLLPSHVLFYNSGAYLTALGSEVLDDLTRLKEAGVEVLTCGACLDFFHLKEKLMVGEVTNMYRILEIMSQTRVVKP